MNTRSFHTILNHIRPTYGFWSIPLSTILIYMVLASCTSSRDLYKNPIPPVNRTISYQSTELTTASDSTPNWINAVSKDFYVGTGYGKNIDEARRSALNDIKSFILTSIGETGSVTEINIVANETTGRSSNLASENYYNKNSFQNEYKPVINISIENFEDYYWAESLGKASYYIKYHINSNYLEKIRQECINAIEKHNAERVKLQNRIDSMSNINDLDVVEDLCQRQEQLLKLYNTISFPSKFDSIKVVQSVYKIKKVLDDLRFRVISNENNHIEFVLESGGRRISSTHIPWLSSESDLILSQVKTIPSGWSFNYELKPYDKTIHAVGIKLDFPNLTISKKVELENELLNPEIDVRGAIQYVISNYNWLKDKALSGKIRLILFSEKGFNIQRIEMVPVSHAGNNAIILLNEHQIIEPGTNIIEWESSKVFPVPFLETVSECDITLYYNVNEQLDFKTFKSIPFKAID